MGKTIHKALQTVRHFTIDDTEDAQLFRFSIVYILLFLLMLCGSSGVFGKTETARVSLEKFEVKPLSTDAPLFGNYYLDTKLFNGVYEKLVPELQSLVNARQDFVEKANLQERAELTKLKEEHRNLMVNAAGSSNEVKDKKLAEYTDWSVALYNNISQQALSKQSSLSKIASWDAKNFVKVKAVNNGGKKYVVSIQIYRAKKGAPSKVASLP